MTDSSLNAALAEADRCVKCGLCLPHCPTYRLYDDENESPRGRIALAEGLLRGQLQADASLSAHLDNCLLCRRCEKVCPSKVGYARLIDQARSHYPGSDHWPARLIEHPKLLRGLAQAARLIPGENNMFGSLARSLPASVAAPSPGTYPPAAPPIGRVGLFLGCITRFNQGSALQAALQLLNRLGYEVVVPHSQTCCGALAQHKGDPQAADRLAAINRKAFAGVEHLVSIASACSAHLAETNSTGARALDIHQFLASAAGWEKVEFRPLPAKLALHQPCSMTNVIGGDRLVSALLQRIPGLTIHQLGDTGGCCGAAGDHMLTHRQQARRLRQPLLEQLAQLDADYLSSSNIGCAMHLAQGMKQQKLDVEFVHPVELLTRQAVSLTAASESIG